MVYKKHILGKLQITRKCNQNCVFCSAPPSERELTLDEIKEKITDLKKSGTTDILLTGGEPTLRKDLFEIVDFCKKINFPEITIQTNGSILDNFEFLKKLKQIFPRIKLNISFHSSDPEIFAKISQKSENYRKLLKGLENTRKLKIHVYLTIVICKLNYKKLKEHIKFINEKFPHIKHFVINFIDPDYKAKENSWLVPTFSETEKYIYETVEFLKNNNLSFRFEKLPLCYMSQFEEYSSDIRRSILDENRFTLFLRTQDDKRTQEKLTEKNPDYYFHTSKCKKCRLKVICPGVNPRYIDVHGSDEVFPVFKDPIKIAKKVRKSRGLDS